MSETNPYNSSAVNTLFVLMRTGWFDSTVIESMIEDLNTNKELREQVEAQITAAKYNESKLKFSQHANRDSCPGQFDLSPEAYQLMGYFTGIMTQAGLFAINKQLICKDLNWNRTKQDKFSSYVTELENRNIIQCISKAKKRSHTPCGYIMNPNVAWIRHNNKQEENKIPQEVHHETYMRGTIGLPVITADGSIKKQIFGTIQEVQEAPNNNNKPGKPNKKQSKKQNIDEVTKNQNIPFD